MKIREIGIKSPIETFCDNPASDVEVLIDDAKEQVRSETGVYPNKLVLAPKAFNALKRNKRIRDFMQR